MWFQASYSSLTQGPSYRSFPLGKRNQLDPLTLLAKNDSFSIRHLASFSREFSPAQTRYSAYDRELQLYVRSTQSFQTFSSRQRLQLYNRSQTHGICFPTTSRQGFTAPMSLTCFHAGILDTRWVHSRAQHCCSWRIISHGFRSATIRIQPPWAVETAIGRPRAQAVTRIVGPLPQYQMHLVGPGPQSSLLWPLRTPAASLYTSTPSEASF